MALPTSRNNTYTPASPVLSNDLNALQDCVVGNKHGPMTLWIGPSAFVGWPSANPSSPGGELDPTTGAFFDPSGGATTARADIPLPAGKRIVSVEVVYSVNNTALNLTPKVRRQTMTTAALADVVAGAADNTGGAGVIESQVLVANHVMLSTDVYFVEVAFGSGAQRLYGAKIIYDAL